MTACPPGHQVLGAGCHCAALPAGPHLGFRPSLHQQRVSGHGLSLHHLQRLPGGLHLCLSLRLTEKGEGGRALLRDTGLVREAGRMALRRSQGPLVHPGHLPNVDHLSLDRGRAGIQSENNSSKAAQSRSHCGCPCGPVGHEAPLWAADNWVPQYKISALAVGVVLPCLPSRALHG